MGVEDRKQRAFAAREQDILSAALSLFQDEDWRNVTVAQIAVQAGIGKGTVYKHFSSKEAIYAELATEFFQRLLQRMRAIDPMQPPLEWIRDSIRLAFAHYLDNSQYRHLVLFCSRPAFRNQLEDYQRQRFEQIDQNFTELFAGALARGVVAGLFPDRPVMQLGFPLEAAFNGAMQMIWEGCTCGAGEELSSTDREGLQPLLLQLEQFMLAGLVYQNRELL